MSTTTTLTEAPALVTVTQQPAITAENVLRLFPEVNTSLIGGSHNSATDDSALDGYDEEQIRLMDEVCIVLDNDDIPIGSATKKLCKSTPSLTETQTSPWHNGTEIAYELLTLL
jgi:isopentenyl-diphosphate delta-isomerase